MKQPRWSVKIRAAFLLMTVTQEAKEGRGRREMRVGIKNEPAIAPQIFHAISTAPLID